MADRRTPALLARVAEAAADPPPAWLPLFPQGLSQPSVLYFLTILRLILLHSSAPGRLDLALPPLAAVLAAAEPADTASAATQLASDLSQSAAKMQPDGRYEIDPAIPRAMADWGLLPLICDRARDMARPDHKEQR